MEPKGLMDHFMFGTYATCKYCGIELNITKKLYEIKKHWRCHYYKKFIEPPSTSELPTDETEGETTIQDWRHFTTTLNDKLEYIFESRLYSDVKLSVSNGKSKKEFKAHQLILSLSSEVFEAALNGSFKESSTKLIEIYDIEHDIFEIFLAFLYTNYIELESVEQSMRVYEVAQKYMVHFLKEICLKYLRENITASVACIGLEFANVIQTQTEDVISDESFLNANVETLLTILSQNMLTASELDVFIAIEKWINNMIKVYGEQIKEELCEKVIMKISYFNMTPKEFTEGPVNSGLLKDDQWPSILANIVSDNCRTPLPDGFIENWTQLPFYNTNYN